MSGDPDSTAGSTGRRRSRRRFLAAVGTASTLTLAGCAGDGDDGTPTDGGGDGGDGGGDGTPTGTTTGDGGGESVTVQMAMPPPVANAADATRQALHDAGLPDNISVEFLATSQITGDVRSQYRQWISAGRDNPDVFRMDNGWTIPFIVRGQLVNLSEHLSDEATSSMEENYFSAMLNTATGREGSIYGIPWQVGFPTVQYRKDLVTEAGFDPEGNSWATEPMDWQRFSEVVARTHRQSDVNYGFAWQGNDYEGLSCCTFNEYMTSWGGAYFGGRENLFGPVGERPITVDSRQVVDALRMARTFVQGPDDEHALDGYQQISPDAVLQWTEGPSSSAFMDGNAVALRYWPSAIPQGVEAFGDDLGVMPIPYGIPQEEAEGEGLGGTASALGGWHLTVNPNSQNVEAAVQVVEATMDRGFREFQFQELGYLTPDQRLFSADAAPEGWGPHMETLGIAGENAIPRPVTVVWPDESPLISSQVNSALAAQKPPDRAMSDLKSSLRDIEESV